MVYLFLYTQIDLMRKLLFTIGIISSSSTLFLLSILTLRVVKEVKVKNKGVVVSAHPLSQ